MGDQINIKTNEIEKKAKEVGVPAELLEKHVKVLKLAFRIQEFEGKLILYGGTAAQFYLPDKFQRTSRDVDFITNLNKKEVDERVVEFCNKNPDIKLVKKKDMEKTYGKRYNFETNLDLSRDTNPQTIAVEIASRKKEQLISREIKGCRLHGFNCGDFIVLKKEDLLAKKFITLDLGRLGRKTDESTEIGKQIYDIKRLYDTLGKKYTHIGEIIYTQFQNEINNGKIKSSPDDCITNICKNLFSLSFMRTGKNGNGRITKVFEKGWRGIKTISPYDAKLDISQWGALGWDFAHFLKSIQTDHKNQNVEKILNHFALRDEYLGKDKEKVGLKATLIKELKKYGYLRNLKGRPLLSLIYAKELHEVFGK